MADPSAIRVEALSKKFRVHHREPGTTLKGHLLRGRWWRARSQIRINWAIRELDFEVPKGTTLGVIGKNGSGKSTLLRLLNGTLRPTDGSVTVAGRVSALIELGAGFHPELTGRENLLINGIICGLSKREVRERFDEIVAFAELEDRIEEPLRTYSAGMMLRLGFAVATSVRPDVVLLDELIAVGDAGFTQRCFARMNEFKRSGCTIAIVSHDPSVARNWCDQVLWLDAGRRRMFGDPAEVVSAYLADTL